MFVLLLASTLAFSFNLQSVKASGTIYIRADGSIDPPTAPISTVDNVAYSLTSNITSDADGIVVERDNIVVDGAGYTVQGTGADLSKGIDLSATSNVTMRNIEIRAFYFGVYGYLSPDISIIGNNITENAICIYFYDCLRCNITGNNVMSTVCGIYLYGGSDYAGISENNITNNEGINLQDCSGCSIVENRIANTTYGIGLSRCSYNSIVENKIDSSTTSIYLGGSSNNGIYGNDVTDGEKGITIIYSSDNNSISGNNITANTDYGIFAQSSSNNNILRNNIAANSYQGIMLWVGTSVNRIIGNNISGSFHGVYLGGSSNNSISENDVTENAVGIFLITGSQNNSITGNHIAASSTFGLQIGTTSNNTIHHNNFIANAIQTYTISEGVNFWDDGYPSGGNYWSDYTGIDQKSGSNQNEAGSDGMGDTPYIIDAFNQDNYPLMNPWPSGWKLDFAAPTSHPIVDFAVYNGSLYAAADNKLYVKEGSIWSPIDAPTFVTSLETVNVTNRGPPTTDWNNTYGGTSWDAAYALVQTADGGYALAGRTNSYGAGLDDFWLVKTDSNGNMQWNKTYGGTNDEYMAGALVQTTDGGYALAGGTWSFGAGSSDFWLVKTDSNGNMQWNKTYGGTSEDVAFALVQTCDGGYALAGYTWSFGAGIYDSWLVKTDADGSEQWNNTYGGTSWDAAYALVQTNDDGYALAGGTWSFGAGSSDFWLVKTDAAGNMVWNKTYGGANGDAAWALVQTVDGGYALAGWTGSVGAGLDDFWLVKTDSNGNMQWNKTYGGAGNDQAYTLVQTTDGGYTLAGCTASFGVGSSDFWLVETDANGIMQWNQTYGGANSDEASSLVHTMEGGYAIAGRTASFGAGNKDFWLVKTEAFDPYLEEELVIGGQGGLYCYNGTSFSMVFSVPTYIKALGAYNNTLYAGTILDNPPQLYYCNGSTENPTDWQEDTDFSAILNFSGAFGSIDSFAVYDDVMYVGSGGNLYSFNGTDWSIIASYDDVYAFLDVQVYNGKLYLATRDQGWRKPMYQGGTGFSGRVIEFDGENWTTVLDHDYWIYSLEEYDGKLYAGTANKILMYNGTSWETSFNATEGAYYAISMITYDGKVYVGMGNGYIFADPAPAKANPETIVVPEFSSPAILAVLMALTMLAAALTRKKRSRRFS